MASPACSIWSRATQYPVPKNGGSGDSGCIQTHAAPPIPSSAAPMIGLNMRGTGRITNARSMTSNERMKNTAPTAHSRASTMKNGASPIVMPVRRGPISRAAGPNSESTGPSTLCTVANARTDATTIGAKVRAEKSLSTTSTAKKMPVNGAANTAESPAAAPHPSSVLVLLADGRNMKRATFEPTVAPMVTIGPSGPALPPETMVRVDASHCRTAKSGGMRELVRCTAYITCVTPCPRCRIGRIAKTITVPMAPSTGATAIISAALSRLPRSADSSACSPQRMGRMNPSAKKATITPMAAPHATNAQSASRRNMAAARCVGLSSPAMNGLRFVREIGSRLFMCGVVARGGAYQFIAPAPESNRALRCRCAATHTR